MPFRTKKSRIWQYDIIVSGNRFRGTTGTTDYEQAKEVEAQVRADARKETQRGGRYTLSETLGTYIRDVSLGQPSESTSKSQARAILKHMKGSQHIDTITSAHIAAYVAKDRATCANGTVNRRLQLLGRALRHMADIYTAKMPGIDLKRHETKESRERVRELSANEQTRLFKALPVQYHPFVKFALMTGFRIATISNLKWSDVHLDRMEIFARLKGDEILTFPINTELRALLSSLPKSNLIAHRQHVFTRINEQTAERIPIVSNGGVFGAAWRQALTDANIQNFRFHDLRHSFCTRLLRQTGNIKLVSKLAGHKSIETTTRYAHVLVDDMRAAMDGYSAFAVAENIEVPQNNPQIKTKFIYITAR